MGKESIKNASLDELKSMRERGELFYKRDAEPGPDMDDSLWADAEIVKPVGKTSVHLRVDSDVLEFFKCKGKGHLTRMNAVLRRYMEVQTSKTENKS